MRLLFIVPYTPNRIRARPYYLLHHLAAQGAQITLLTLSANEAERAEAQALESICERVLALPLPAWRSAWNCLLAAPGRAPLQSAYCWHPGLAGRAGALLNGGNGRPAFDAIHVEHLRGVRYGLALARAADGPGRKRPALVWDSVDCISHLFEQAAAQGRGLFGRWVTRFELGRTRSYEPAVMAAFDQVLVSSAPDQQALLGLVPAGAPRPRVSVLTNGVDLDYFRPEPDETRAPATLVVSGKMSYHANVSMVLYLAEQVMPLVWRQRPDVRLQVVGKDPPARLRALAANPAVEVTGTVPDVRPYLRRATLALAPLRYGAGIQNKALEAMACGTPVLASPEALGGLSAAPGRELATAADGPSMAAEILALLGDP
ncbi:MAG: glycosyltransferase, partial [Candidatus Promineifilaceae bacterium]